MQSFDSRYAVIGVIPAHANWHKPKRVEFPALSGDALELDAPAWLARFDTLENGAWDPLRVIDAAVGG